MSNMMRRGSSLVLAFLLSAAGFAQQAAPTITLDQSISAALANGDEYKILQANLAASRAQHALNVSKNSFVASASAGYGAAGYGSSYAGSAASPFGMGSPPIAVVPAGSASALGTSGVPSNPQVGLSLSGPLTTINVTSTPWVPPTGSSTETTSNLAASLNQVLWNGYPGGSQQATVDKSLLSLQGKELSTESGRLALVYKVKQAYYTMLSAQRTLDVKRATLDKQNALLKQIQAVYDLKQASLVDLKTAQANAKSAQIDVDSSQHDLRVARITLANLMGSPSDQDFAVSSAGDPQVPAATLDDAVAQGLKNRVDLKQIDLSVQSSNVDLALARGLGTPTVSVMGSVNVVMGWSGLATGTVAAGAKVSMPVLDADGVTNQVDAILQQNAAYNAQEDQLRKSIALDIENAWDGVALAREKLELAALSADTADLQFQIQKALNANGTASNQDLLTASVNSANAQSALEAAKSAVQLAILQLQSVMGL